MCKSRNICPYIATMIHIFILIYFWFQEGEGEEGGGGPEGQGGGGDLRGQIYSSGQVGYRCQSSPDPH